MECGWMHPEWPVPATVTALQTTRVGGVSAGPWRGLNLGGHVGDDPAAVAANRTLLARALPAEPFWLNQVHGVRVADADSDTPGVDADAAVSRLPGRPLAILTADCLPVLLCDLDGTVVGAAHAGWRGLAGGVLEAAVAAMGVPPGRITAWLGPAIGQDAFEVGGEVREAFAAADAAAAGCFRPGLPGKWHADLAGLARLRLSRAGVAGIYGGGPCTFSDPVRFFSYRRDGQTGRMATLIWLKPSAAD